MTKHQLHCEATIEADERVPVIRITRDFAATPAQLIRAHTDPELFVRWVGPDGMDTRIVNGTPATAAAGTMSPGATASTTSSVVVFIRSAA